jgi:hypothetical protein
VDETTLIHLLHDLAKSIAAARAANNPAAVQGLWVQFQTAADNLRAIGSTDIAILNLINSTGAGVESFLKGTGQAAGTAVSDVLGGIFSGLSWWTPVLIGGLVLWFAWPYLIGARRRVTARG